MNLLPGFTAINEISDSSNSFLNCESIGATGFNILVAWQIPTGHLIQIESSSEWLLPIKTL